MQAYNRLPPRLRAWLSEAVLPWSPQSARRAWRKALRDTGGDEGAACARLSRIEADMLRRDAPRVWAEGHPVRDPGDVAVPRNP